MDPSSLIVLLLFLGVMYFVLIRPQRQQQKQRREMLSALEVGDDVVTIGGLHGNVVTIDDTEGDATVDLLVTDDVVLRFRRSAIAEVRRDPVDVAEEADEADDESTAEA